MSYMSLRLIGVRVDHLHQPDQNRNVALNLTEEARKPLAADKRHITEFAAEEIKS